MDKYFVKSFFVYGGTAGASRILPILMLPIYLASLGPDAYGKVEIIFSFFQFALIFGLLQLETALQRLYFKVGNRSALFYSLLTGVMASSLFVFIGCYIFSEALALLFFDSVEERQAIVVAAMSILFANIATICMVFLRFMDKPIDFILITVGQVVLTIGFTYFYLIMLEYGVLGYFLGLFLGWFFAAVVSFCRVTKNIKFSFDFSFINSAFAFAIPQLPARLASFFIQYGNRFFVLYLLGAQAVGLMGLSLKFAALFQLLLLAFSMAWNPFLYKNEKSISCQADINKIFLFLLICLTVFHVVTVFLSSLIIEQFFTEDYWAASQYVALAIVPIQLLIIKEVVESGVKLSNKTQYISYAYLFSVLVTIICMFFSKTIDGILLSAIVGSLVLVILSWYFSERNFYLKYNKFYFLIYCICISLTFLYENK
jgi:O-antigen/teichoic acid export membrane protein